MLNTRSFYLTALNANAARNKAWVLSVFCLIEHKEGETLVPYEVRAKDGKWWYNDPEHGLTTIDHEYPTDQPLLNIKDRITLQVNDLGNVDRIIETNCGNTLWNQVALVDSFGSKIPFITGRINIGKDVEPIIAKRLKSDPLSPSEPIDPQAIYIKELVRFNNAIGMISGYSQICVPTASPRSMTADPRIPEIRAALLKKYEGRLNDASVIAEIEAELLKVDKEWIQNSESAGFYITSKLTDVSRKKVFLMHGMEVGFGDGTNVVNIPNSLNDGWDPKYIPNMVDSLREGSHSRGALTALGGEAVKFLGRVFQNVAVAEEDCGSTRGRTRVITKKHEGYYILVQNKLVHLSPDVIGKYIGTTQLMRSPQYCLTPKDGFCKCCVGDSNASSPRALALRAATVGSRFMDLFMGAMHGKKLATAKWQFRTSIT